MDPKKTETRTETASTATATATAPIKNFAESALAEYEKGVERFIEQSAAQTAEAFRTARAFNGTVLSTIRDSVDSAVAATASMTAAAEGAWKNITRTA